MGVTHLELVTMMVMPLAEHTQLLTSCVLHVPANALVTVLVLNSKCRVVLLANAKGKISKRYQMWVSNTCSDSC